MTDNIVVAGKYVFLATEMKRVYVYNRETPPLGRGGMGTVYIGKDCLNGTSVAIKQLHPSLCSLPWLRTRMREESALIFSHENIVEMLGYSEYKNHRGPIFVISKYVEGTTIDNAIYRYGADAANVIKTMLPIFNALEFLHSQGVYHLDIKPTNIMIDDFSVVKLMDLGVTNLSVASAGYVSNELSCIGTPSYAAPEQFIVPGKEMKVDGRSDIYELGVTLYKLICGTNPYDQESLSKTYHKHINYAIEPHVKIPDRVYNVLAKATEVNPDDRFQTVQEFKTALEEAITPQRGGIFSFFKKLR